MRVTVAGAGTAGLAAALLLHRAGHEVEVLERFADPQPVGAGLLLQPTGLAVLERLGLRDEVVAGGARVERLRGRTTRGRTVMDLRYGDLKPGLAGLGVHRGVLFGALWAALQAEGVPVRTGVTLEDPSGAPGDLLVDATGARSVLRAKLGIPHRVGEYPWGALWCIVPDPGDAFGGLLDQTYRGTRRMVGFLPTGGAVSMFWSVPAGTPAPASLDALADEAGALDPRARTVLAQLPGPEALLPATYLSVRMRRWHTDRAVALGDAGHAMSPQLGQGANLALMDAAALADALAAQPTSLPSALARYSAARRDHLRFYALASRALTPVFQSRAGLLAAPRDALMGPLGGVPWVRRQMLESLAGVKTGLRGSIDLPA